MWIRLAYIYFYPKPEINSNRDNIDRYKTSYLSLKYLDKIQSSYQHLYNKVQFVTLLGKQFLLWPGKEHCCYLFKNSRFMGPSESRSSLLTRSCSLLSMNTSCSLLKIRFVLWDCPFHWNFQSLTSLVRFFVLTLSLLAGQIHLLKENGFH